MIYRKGTKLCIYLGGPITHPTTQGRMANLFQAITAYSWLLNKGASVVCPHLNMLVNFCIPEITYEHHMGNDIELLSRCDLMVRLPGRSKGTDREEAVAKELNIPVVTGKDWQACVQCAEKHITRRKKEYNFEYDQYTN